MHSRLFLLAIACGALLATQSVSASSNSHEVYVEAGLLGGKGVGYAHHFNDVLGVRADVSTASAGRNNIRAGQFRYDAHLKNRQMGVYADWFPFGGKFHLSAGLHTRKLNLDVDGRANAAKKISIGKIDVDYGDPNDVAWAHVKWPSVAPYLGLGWGHSASQHGGISFISDFGVSFGVPKIQLGVSNILREKLEAVAEMDRKINGTDITANSEIERQRRSLAKDAGKLKVFPHAFIGVAYRF